MKYKSEAFAALHKNAVAMYKVDGITEESMREYDEMCLKNPKIKKQPSSVYVENNSAKIKIASHATA